MRTFGLCFFCHSFDTLNVPYHRAPQWYVGILLCHVAAPAYASQRRNNVPSWSVVWDCQVDNYRLAYRRLFGKDIPVQEQYHSCMHSFMRFAKIMFFHVFRVHGSFHLRPITEGMLQHAMNFCMTIARHCWRYDSAYRQKAGEERAKVRHSNKVRCAAPLGRCSSPGCKTGCTEAGHFEGLFHCSGTTLSQSGKASESNMKASSIVVYWISGMAVCAMELKWYNMTQHEVQFWVLLGRLRQAHHSLECLTRSSTHTNATNARSDKKSPRTSENVRERGRIRQEVPSTQYPVLTENPADVLDQHSPCGGCHFEAGGLLCARACRVLSRYLLLEAKECWSLSSPNCQKLFQHSQTISDVSKSDQE